MNTEYHILTSSLDCYAMAWSAIGNHKKCLQAFRHPKYLKKMMEKKVLIDEPLALDIEMYQDSELLLKKHGDCSATINCISTSVVSIGLGVLWHFFGK